MSCARPFAAIDIQQGLAGTAEPIGTVPCGDAARAADADDAFTASQTPRAAGLRTDDHHGLERL